MKKIIIFLVAVTVFTGCKMFGYKKVDEQRESTVHIIDAGSFNVKGEIEYHKGGRIDFTDQLNRDITTHITRCVIVDATNAKPIPQQPTAPTQKAQAPPTPKKEPKKE